MTLFFAALIIATLAILSLGLNGLATLEYKIADAGGQHTQLTQIIQSGIVAAAQAVDDPECFNLFHNAERFRNMMIVPADSDFLSERMDQSDSIELGRFTVFSPDWKQGQWNGIRFGLTRESAKLSLEAILAWEMESPGQGVLALEKLSGMTPEISDSLLDWLDADDQARAQGAESDYYQQQKKRYRSRNAVPVTLEELLLIRGIERPLVFGNDPSLTWGATQAVLRSADSTPTEPINLFAPLPAPDSALRRPQYADPQEEGSWQWVLTPYSAEKLVNDQGVARIFLNESDLNFLESQLRLHQIEEESIRFIMAWRQEKGNIDDPLDLLDTEITLDSETLFSPFSCMEPMKYEVFLRLLDETTTESTVVLRGRINVNEAPRQVLEAVPELTPELVTAILERRESSAEMSLLGNKTTSGEMNGREKRGGRYRHAVWLLAEEIVDKEMMKTLSRRLTTGGDVYRFQIAAFFEGETLLSRAEAVLDATVKPPRTVSYKDLTALRVPE